MLQQNVAGLDKHKDRGLGCGHGKLKSDDEKLVSIVGVTERRWLLRIFTKAC